MKPMQKTLPDNWHMRPVKTFQQGTYALTGKEWLATSIPGHWQQHPDMQTYHGNVVYACQFAYPDLPQQEQRLWLRVNGIFYWSQPYLNGSDLGKHEGYFEPYEHDISNIVQQENALIVEVACPLERSKTSKRMITGVFSHWDCLDPQANPGGIWLPIELVESGAVHIQSVRCHSETFNEKFAQLRYAVDVDSTIPGPVMLRWIISPRTFEGEIQIIEQQRTIREGQQTIQGMFKMREPHLWWTHDLGNPNLYTITLEMMHNGVLSDSYNFDYGIRRFELRKWIPYLNGERFLIKGNNYAPGDVYMATMTPERYAQDMSLARDCHMNFLRVHAHVEHPAFYAAANNAGILLWQDMPLQWSYHAAVLPEAKRQTKAMVHLLSNHPAIGIWCMHNEPIFLSDTSDETWFSRLRTYQSVFGFSWNRDILDTQLKKVAEQEDSTRPVVRSSGEFSLPPLRDGTDAHIYFGWYRSYGNLQNLEKTRLYLKENIRFVTEFGAQSFPNVESCLKFMPADIREIDMQHLAERHGLQPDILHHWVPWREANSLEELVHMTQAYQISLNRFYIDRLRYHKYRPTGGIVPFLFCDPYPAILWSIVDYWRQPKRSYYAMRLAFSPQYVFTLIYPKTHHIQERIELPIYVVNDAHRVLDDVQVIAQLRAPDGEDLASVSHTITLAYDSLAQEIDRLRLTPDRTGTYTLKLKMTGVLHEVEQIYPIDVAM